MQKHSLRPTISVVIPYHNGSAHFLAAVESVLKQTHKPMEILVVENGSTRNETKWLEMQVASLEEVRLVSSDEVGQSAARNLGVKLCNADYVAFLDQDDLFEPEKLEEIMQALVSDSSIDIIGNQYSIMDSGGNLMSRVKIRIPVRSSFAFRNIRWIPSSFTVRKDFFLQRLDGFRKELQGFEDEDLILRALELKARLVVSNKFLTRWRVGHRSASNSKSMQHSRVLFAKILNAEISKHKFSRSLSTASLFKFTIGHLRGFRRMIGDSLPQEDIGLKTLAIRDLTNIVTYHKLCPKLLRKLAKEVGVAYINGLPDSEIFPKH